MIKLPEKSKLSTLALSDPLSKETETKRTQVMFVACSSILLTVYGLKINKTPWLDIEVPTGAPNILHGALSVALVYTFVVFMVHAWTDFNRWWIAREAIELKGYEGFLIQLHNHLNGMRQLVSAPPTDSISGEKTVELEITETQGSQQLSSLRAELSRLQRRHTTLTTVQYLRIVTIDIGVPMFLAAVAFAKVGSSLGPFLSAIAK